MQGFTDNYQDQSNRDGYQFEFYCEHCHDAWRSPFDRYVFAGQHDALDAAQKRAADFECSFLVDGFQLYLHGEDGVWRVARDFWFGSP